MYLIKTMIELAVLVIAYCIVTNLDERITVIEDRHKNQQDAVLEAFAPVTGLFETKCVCTEKEKCMHHIIHPIEEKNFKSKIKNETKGISKIKK